MERNVTITMKDVKIEGILSQIESMEITLGIYPIVIELECGTHAHDPVVQIELNKIGDEMIGIQSEIVDWCSGDVDKGEHHGYFRSWCRHVHIKHRTHNIELDRIIYDLASTPIEAKDDWADEHAMTYGSDPGWFYNPYEDDWKHVKEYEKKVIKDFDPR